MYSLPLDADATVVHRADWIEVQMAADSAPGLSIDEVTDYWRDAPSDLSSDEELSADQGKWSKTREDAEDAFREIAWRATWLGERYPIRFEESEVVTWNEKSSGDQLYRFLVLLRAKQMIGSDLDGGTVNPGYLFEEIVTLATDAYLAGGQAVRFGVAGGHRGGGLPSDLRDAVIELARRMEEEPAGSVGGTGDYRADVVAWHPFGDKRPGQLIVLSSATIAEREWQTKEIPRRWTDGRGRLIRFVASPMSAVAFVETMSLYPPDFWKGATFDSVPFDRLRIVSVIADSNIDHSILLGTKEWTDWAISKLPS